jgi:hypothetical protein
MVQDIGPHAIVSVAPPQDQENQFMVSFTGMLIQRLVKPQAASATFFLNGIAGIVAARCAIRPDIAEINAAIRSELSKGGSVSIFASPASDLFSEDLPGITSNNVATSFIAFLIDTSGNTALQQFLAEYDAERQDQAALAAYQRPLGQLEEAWLAYLRKSATQKNAVVTFTRRILPLLKPYWWRNTQVIIYSLLGLAFNAIIPFAIRFLIDTIIPQKNVPLLIAFSSVMFGLFLFGALIGTYRAKVIAEVVQYVVLDLQQKSFSHLQVLSHHFYVHAKVGDLMSRLSSDLQMVQQAISQVIGNGIFTICNTLVAIVILLSLQPIVGGLMLLIIPLLIVSYRLLSKRLRKPAERIRN